MNKLISTKNRIFISLVGPSDSGKTCLIHEWLKVGTFQPKFDKINFFYQHRQPRYDVMQKEVDNLEFVQGVHFEFTNSLKNNGTKYLLCFDDPCAEFCNYNEFVDIAIAGRHRGFSSIYNKQNLFHQSKLGRGVELENTHIVLFNSPRYVHQVATLSVQLRLGSTLVDWMQRLHLLVICWLVCLREQTIAYATAHIEEVLHQSFVYPTTWSIWKIWPMNTLNLSTLQAFQHFSLAWKLQFLKTCPKEFIRFLSECIVNLLQENLSEVKKKHVLK